VGIFCRCQRFAASLIVFSYLFAGIATPRLKSESLTSKHPLFSSVSLSRVPLLSSRLLSLTSILSSLSDGRLRIRVSPRHVHQGLRRTLDPPRACSRSQEGCRLRLQSGEGRNIAREGVIQLSRRIDEGQAVRTRLRIETDDVSSLLCCFSPRSSHGPARFDFDFLYWLFNLS
jgi:hypothetical protein